MHNLILFLVKKSLPKSQKINRKQKPIENETSQNQQIFSSDDESIFEYIYPSLLISPLSFTQLISRGLELDIRINKKEYHLNLIIGPQSIGKSHLISQLMKVQLKPIQRMRNDVVIYQNEKECFLEYTTISENAENQFFRDILIKICSNVIQLTDDPKCEPISNCIILYHLRTQSMIEEVIQKQSLVKGKEGNHYYYGLQNTIHFFELNKYLRQNLLYSNPIKDIKKQIINAIQFQMNQVSQLLPYQVKVNEQLKIQSQIPDLRILEQYMIDHYNNGNKGISFEFIEDHAIIKPNKNYFKLSLIKTQVKLEQLEIHCQLLDIRFNLLIPFVYKRKTKKENVTILFQGQQLIILSFI